jgi:hypothetical protein
MIRFLRLLPAFALVFVGLPLVSQAADHDASPEASADAQAAAPAPAQKPEEAAKPPEAPKPAEAPKPPPAPAVIPAIAPIRVLQVDPPKREGLIPDIKIGPTKLKLYGYFKTSVVYDSSSPYGNDFPLPFFIADTGPDGSPEFHIKARSPQLPDRIQLRVAGQVRETDRHRAPRD